MPLFMTPSAPAQDVISGDFWQNKMAPIGEKTDRNNVYGDSNEDEEDQNLW